MKLTRMPSVAPLALAATLTGCHLFQDPPHDPPDSGDRYDSDVRDSPHSGPDDTGDSAEPPHDNPDDSGDAR